MKTTFYIVSPNGRLWLVEDVSDDKAIEMFKAHWTAHATWVGGRERRLVKTTTETVYTEKLYTK